MSATDNHPAGPVSLAATPHHRRPATLDTMVASVERRVAQAAHKTGRFALSSRVHAALHEVLREAFVPPEIKRFAYITHPLPIGFHQTMPEPFIIALMTELLDLGSHDSVLEIGTGSGYQTAILARLAKHVYSIELVPELATYAKAALMRLNYKNITLRVGNGVGGWPEHAPYDAILITAPTPEIDPKLIDQLKPAGRLVAAVGPTDSEQILTTVTKLEDGRITRNRLLDVHLAPTPQHPDVHEAAETPHPAAGSPAT